MACLWGPVSRVGKGGGCQGGAAHRTKGGLGLGHRELVASRQVRGELRARAGVGRPAELPGAPARREAAGPEWRGDPRSMGVGQGGVGGETQARWPGTRPGGHPGARFSGRGRGGGVIRGLAHYGGRVVVGLRRTEQLVVRVGPQARGGPPGVERRRRSSVLAHPAHPLPPFSLHRTRRCRPLATNGRDRSTLTFLEAVLVRTAHPGLGMRLRTSRGRRRAGHRSPLAARSRFRRRKSRLRRMRTSQDPHVQTPTTHRVRGLASLRILQVLTFP